MTNAAGKNCNTRAANLGYLNSNMSYSVSASIEFVKTGPIKAGTFDPFQTRFGFRVYNGSSNGGLGGLHNYIGFSGSATSREIACSITYPAVVGLPTVSASTLADQGSAGNTAFSIQLLCGDSAIVGMTLEGAAGTPMQAASQGILGIINAGTAGAASGVGLQIVSSDYASPVPLQVRNPMGNIAANVPATYRFGARYVSLGGTPSPGAVSSAMIFTMDYQYCDECHAALRRGTTIPRCSP